MLSAPAPCSTLPRPLIPPPAAGSAGPLLWPFTKLQPFIGRLVPPPSAPAHPGPPPCAASHAPHPPQGGRRPLLLPGGARLHLSHDPEPGEGVGLALSAGLLGVAAAAEGLSGRGLRKVGRVRCSVCGVGQGAWGVATRRSRRGQLLCQSCPGIMPLLSAVASAPAAQLPFLAHALHDGLPCPAPCATYLDVLVAAAAREHADAASLVTG